MKIERTGLIKFHDASLHVWEEGLAVARGAGSWKEAQEWERQLKRDVFTRIVQQLRRLGWTVGPNTYIFTSNNNRYCRKGDLRADLKLSGRHIEFQMFQNVNAPRRPDHGGRYEFNKEELMPYLMRLEMERTRRRIRDYLCNVMEAYTFESKGSDGRNSERGPGRLTAMEWVQECYRTSWHFKGDLTTYKISDYNNTSADKQKLQHGQRVWFFDTKGRCRTGIAQYNINNMWWVITGKYDVRNEASFELYTTCPDEPRRKRNDRLRRKRLEAELAKATGAMNFERAAVLRDLLFPKAEPIYLLWHKEHGLYHCSNFSGYSNDSSGAGKFTLAEVRKWAGIHDGMEDGLHKIVPLEAVA